MKIIKNLKDIYNYFFILNYINMNNMNKFLIFNIIYI